MRLRTDASYVSSSKQVWFWYDIDSQSKWVQFNFKIKVRAMIIKQIKKYKNRQQPAGNKTRPLRPARIWRELVSSPPRKHPAAVWKSSWHRSSRTYRDSQERPSSSSPSLPKSRTRLWKPSSRRRIFSLLSKHPSSRWTRLGWTSCAWCAASQPLWRIRRILPSWWVWALLAAGSRGIVRALPSWGSRSWSAPSPRGETGRRCTGSRGPARRAQASPLCCCCPETFAFPRRRRGYRSGIKMRLICNVICKCN